MLQPIPIDVKSPLIIQKMVDASSKAGVGPMASVAGAIADLAVEAMMKAKPQVAIVEDGGEVSAISKKPFITSLYAGQNILGYNIGFKIFPTDCPIGIATSSATISHAISFGEADAVTVFAYNAALADAAATAVCNSVIGEDIVKSINLGLKIVKRMPFVRGALLVRGSHVGSIGWIPKFVNID